VTRRRRRPRTSAPRAVTTFHLLAAMLMVACSGGEPTAPEPGPVRLRAVDGDHQFALPAQLAELPLQVQATDVTSGRAVKDVEVRWTVRSGTGAVITVDNDKTDGLGVAAARIRVGPDTGTYRVEATASKLVGSPATFEVRAVPGPVVESLAPLPAVAGQVITVTGRNFSPRSDDNAVLFGGLRGTTLSASPTQLQVRVPACVLDRETDVRVSLGALLSQPLKARTAGGVTAPIDLAKGESLRLTTLADLQCMSFAGAAAGARYLVVPQNAVESIVPAMRYELNAIAGAGLPASRVAVPVRMRRDVASEFEIELRRRELELGPVAVRDRPGIGVAGQSTIPAIGDRRDFNVLKSDGTTRRITAAVEAISEHAILYVDVAAPSGGLTKADLDGFGALFDDPIYTTDVSVFGTPSDIDGNDRIIILFTPAVNALTDASASGFIAGYFYGCDLVEASRCSATNGSEIFYSMVPDQTGSFGGVRTKDVVLRTVPAVLAHELQHMINFARKGGSLDVLWLSEGLAHAAEDVVGTVLAERGAAISTDFVRPNYVRAQLYLQRPASTSLVNVESPGSLQERGAAWLLIKYLSGHYGGDGLLGRLTSSAAKGAANVSGAVGRPWAELLSEFAVALWADGATELQGVSIDQHFTFAAFELRNVLDGLAGGYPLVPPVISFQDFVISDLLSAAAQDYLVVQAPSTPGAFNLAYTGLRGGPFSPSSSAQLTVLRLR